MPSVEEIIKEYNTEVRPLVQEMEARLHCDYEDLHSDVVSLYDTIAAKQTGRLSSAEEKARDDEAKMILCKMKLILLENITGAIRHTMDSFFDRVTESSMSAIRNGSVWSRCRALREEIHSLTSGLNELKSKHYSKKVLRQDGVHVVLSTESLRLTNALYTSCKDLESLVMRHYRRYTWKERGPFFSRRLCMIKALDWLYGIVVSLLVAYFV